MTEETHAEARERITREAVERYEALPESIKQLDRIAKEQSAEEAEFILNPRWDV